MTSATIDIRLFPDSRPQQVFILLHGVGRDAQSMLPLGKQLRTACPDAAVLIPNGPHPFDKAAQGRQWYSTLGRTEENRIARVAEALPHLQQLVLATQQELGVLPEAITLAGFSQGAYMALEYTARYEGGIGKVLAFSGRYAKLPAKAPSHTRIHLFHGEDDKVVPVAHALATLAHLQELKGEVTLDVEPLIGHELNLLLIERALGRLKAYAHP